MNKKFKLKGKLITPERIIENAEVCFYDGQITYAGKAKNDDSLYEVTDYGDSYIAPGFIDIHTHGGGGHDFTDGTLEAFVGAAKLHASHGTATLLPTTLSCSDEELFEFFDVFEEAQESGEGSYPAGIHIEGFYCAMSQKGAQDERYIRPPTPEHYEKILQHSDKILRWTIAPELEGSKELIRVLKQRGILSSIGHSDALYEDALEAYENGCTMMTHFYSAMSSMVRKGGFRYPGLIESGYLIDGFDVEVIADGCHLPPVMLNYVYKMKGADKIALITDSMRGAGSTSGESILGSLKDGMKVIIEDGVAKLCDRSAFAGSIATTDRLLRTVITQADVPLVDAVKMLTKTPARIVGLTSKGSIIPGYDADFTVFDGDISIKAVYSNGRKIY